MNTEQILVDEIVAQILAHEGEVSCCELECPQFSKGGAQ